MNNIDEIVFSKTLEKSDWSNTRLVRERAADEVSKLKQQLRKDLFIFGSAELRSVLMKSGLIDEYRLALGPMLLGNGNPLFKSSPERHLLKLVEPRPLQPGCVILRYQHEKR